MTLTAWLALPYTVVCETWAGALNSSSTCVTGGPSTLEDNGPFTLVSICRGPAETAASRVAVGALVATFPLALAIIGLALMARGAIRDGAVP
jgi:hypothetical protein